MSLLINKLKEKLLLFVINKCFSFFGKKPTNIKVLYSNIDALKCECGKNEKIILVTPNKIIVYEYYCDIKMQLRSTNFINLDFFLRSFFKNYIDTLAHRYLLSKPKNQNLVHQPKKSDVERAIVVNNFIERQNAVADRFFDKFDNFIAGYIFKFTQFILFGRSEKFISSPLNAFMGEWQGRESRWIFDNQKLYLFDNKKIRHFTYKIIKNKGNTLKLDTTNIENNKIRIKRTFYFDANNQIIQYRSHGTSLNIWKRIQ